MREVLLLPVRLLPMELGYPRQGRNKAALGLFAQYWYGLEQDSGRAVETSVRWERAGARRQRLVAMAYATLAGCSRIAVPQRGVAVRSSRIGSLPKSIGSLLPGTGTG